MSKRILFCMVFVFLTSTLVHSEKLATIKTSGRLFKDKLQVMVFDDPDIGGISCYITLPDRALSLTDQTDSSISCRKVGPVTGNIVSKKGIFRKKKGIFVKSLFVDRVYDKERNAMIYVSYTKKTSGDNANNSVSVVVLGQMERK